VSSVRSADTSVLHVTGAKDIAVRTCNYIRLEIGESVSRLRGPVWWVEPTNMITHCRHWS